MTHDSIAPVAFAVLFVVWFVSESLARHLGHGPAARDFAAATYDHGSLWAILVGFGGALAFSLGLFSLDIGAFFPAPVLWLGVAVSLIGTALRSWSIVTLGRFFSPIIQIESDHRIVRQGPYRWLRHPSYTGMWFATLGAVLALGTVTGAVVAAVVTFCVLSYRIHLEERMLFDRFGEEYRAYVRSTWRLLPGIY